MARLGGGVAATLRRGAEAPPEFLTDRRATVLARLRLAAVCAAAAITTAMLLSPLLEPGFSASWFLGVLLQLASCGAAYWLAGQRWAEARADALSAGFLLLLAVFMPLTVELVPAKLEIFVGWLTIVVIAGALFFPWGLRPQIATSLGLLAWLLAVFPLQSAPSSQVGEAILLYCVASFLAAFGAYFLDGYRELAF